MKKIYGLFVMAAMTYSFIACDSSNTSEEQQADTWLFMTSECYEEENVTMVCPDCNGGYCDVMEDDPFCHGSGQCPACNGAGRQDMGYGYSVCPICQGTGRCTNCGGSGQGRTVKICSTCYGTGIVGNK